MGAIALNGSSVGSSIPTAEYLATNNGVYNGGTGLTSVGSVQGSTIEADGAVTSTNIGGNKINTNLINISGSSKTDAYAKSSFVCLFGSKVKTDSGTLVDATSEAYSRQVTPKAIKVTLTLTTNNSNS